MWEDPTHTFLLTPNVLFSTSQYCFQEKEVFCKMNTIVEFVVQTCVQETNFTYLVHSVVEL